MKNSLRKFCTDLLKENNCKLDTYKDSKEALKDLKAYELDNPGFNGHFTLKEIANTLAEIGNEQPLSKK